MELWRLGAKQPPKRGPLPRLGLTVPEAPEGSLIRSRAGQTFKFKKGTLPVHNPLLLSRHMYTHFHSTEILENVSQDRQSSEGS